MSLVLKEIRRKNNLTQAQFADKLGITRSAIAQIESGKNNISMPLAKKISKLFKVSLDSLTNNDHMSTTYDLYKDDIEKEPHSLTRSIYYEIAHINILIDQISITKLAIQQFGEDKKMNWNVFIDGLESKAIASGYYNLLKEYRDRTEKDTLNNAFLNKLYHICEIYSGYCLDELYKIVTINYQTLKKYYNKKS